MPCRWAIPNTSAMARSTTSRLGSGGFPILFIVLFTKGLPFGGKNGRMGPTFPAQGVFEVSQFLFEFRAIRLCKSCTEFTVCLDLPHFAEMLGHQSVQNCTLE